MNLDFQYLFTSFDGRINRAKYWAGTIILAIISIVLGFIIGAIFVHRSFYAMRIGTDAAPESEPPREVPDTRRRPAHDHAAT